MLPLLTRKTPNSPLGEEKFEDVKEPDLNTEPYKLSQLEYRDRAADPVNWVRRTPNIRT